MKLGMPQLFEFDEIEENFKLAQEQNLDFIEFNLNFSSCRKAMEDGSLKALAKKYGIDCTLHFYDEADFGSYDEVVQAYLTLLERYAGLGYGFIQKINVHLIPGPVVTISGVKHYVNEKEYAEYIERLLRNFKQAEAICNEYGIEMIIENTDKMPPFCSKTYRDLHLNHFNFCYDIGHDHLSRDFLKKLLEEYPLPIHEFHFHDGKDFSKCHLSLGEGSIDLKEKKDLAAQLDRQAEVFVNLEVKQKADIVKSVPFFRSI